MNIAAALVLINNKKTTIEDVISFIMKDIELFQDKREAYYIQEFKEQYEGQIAVFDDDFSTRIAEKVSAKIESDTRNYVLCYTSTAIDSLLDAFNEKKIKTKNGFTNFLTLLTQMREQYSKAVNS